MHLHKLNNRLKSLLPDGTNIAIALAELLSISKEGAYRRLRGDTSFTLDELMILRKKIGISIDELTEGTENVSFSFKPLYDKPLELDEYFKDIQIRFKKLSHIKGTMTYNVCEDLPFFRQFGYPALASFKLFYWKHSILLDPNFALLKFNLQSIAQSTLDDAAQMNHLYTRIPSTEIWTNRTIKNTLKQIEYFYDCGFFENDEVLLAVYKAVINLLYDLMHEARLAVKLDANSNHKGKFTLHICELSLDNNSIYLETDEPKYLATGFNGFNSLHTMDTRLLSEYKKWLSAMISKSTNISGQAERIRHDFYKYNTEIIKESANQRLPEKMKL
jgi:hypothetical protein